MEIWLVLVQIKIYAQPLSGFNESRYNVVKSRVVYEKVELAQEYRSALFNLIIWVNIEKIA